jgi:hypothetical protein
MNRALDLPQLTLLAKNCALATLFRSRLSVFGP